MADDWQCPKCTRSYKCFAKRCIACHYNWPQGQSVMPDLSSHVTDADHKMGGRLGWNTDFCPDVKIRIVLFGRTGSGKSTTANNILDRNVFESDASGSSVTKKCQTGTCSRNGRNIEITDSPGFFDTGMTNADITREIIKCIGITAPGPHAFVFVVRIDRFTKEEQDTVEHFKKVFGEGMLRYLIVLFTRKDDLIHNNKTFQQYLQNAPKGLNILLQSCNNRCVAFNNRGTEGERNQDVEEFLSLVDVVVMENMGRYYSSEMYEEAEKYMKEREDQLRREHEKAMNKIQREFEIKFQQQQDEHKQSKERIQELENEKLEAKKKNEEETMRAPAQQLELKHMKKEHKELEKNLDQERKQAEAGALKKLQPEITNIYNLRCQACEEVSKESGLGFRSLMSSMLPHLIKEALPYAVPAVKALLRK